MNPKDNFVAGLFFKAGAGCKKQKNIFNNGTFRLNQAVMTLAVNRVACDYLI